MFVTGLAAVALAVAIVILRRRPTAQSSPEMAFATRCNIRRLRPRGTLPSSAEEPYIVDLGRQRNAALAARLTRERLLDEMGDTCTTPSQAGSNRKGIETCMPLREYVSEWMDREVRRNSSENKYVFGEFSDAWAPLREAYALPPCGAACARERVAVTIGLGGLHSGAPWHMHGSAFVEVLHGSKHFAFLPPGDAAIEGIDAAIAGLSQVHWHWEERPRLEAAGRLAALQECALQPGELLYFPPSWHHGVVNLDPYTAFVSTFL
jgi:hypothetical protein